VLVLYEVLAVPQTAARTSDTSGQRGISKTLLCTSPLSGQSSSRSDGTGLQMHAPGILIWFQRVYRTEDCRLLTQLLKYHPTGRRPGRRECWDRNKPPWPKFVMEYDDDDDEVYICSSQYLSRAFVTVFPPTVSLGQQILRITWRGFSRRLNTAIATPQFRIEPRDISTQLVSSHTMSLSKIHFVIILPLMLTYPEHAASSTLPSQRTADGPFLVTTDFHGANIRDSSQQSNGVNKQICYYKQCE
jgi:hypothetical protein